MIISMKDKYIYRSRISEKKFREILRYFVLDIEAIKISKLVGISQNSIGKILKQIRILMASECEKVSYFSGKIEIDESYFLLHYVRNCKQKELKEFAVKEAEVLVEKHLFLVC